MQLKQGTLLQGGKYKIERMLGQGGFGITYLAENTMLEGKVAIKEFFFKEYCDRDETTSHVTIGTKGNRELVERFKQKFIKEARTIFKLNHPNIVRILDIFEENGTAYYVMDYIEGESLSDMVKRHGAIPEAEAIGYIKEVASALSYIHGKSINHLDIKPGNIMKRKEDGQILVIDFGVAKQYDAETAEGTTTTPVGISHGYSPTEQYQRHGVQTFSPQSDVYALAATLYKLLTGVTPPEAMIVQDEGLPEAELKSKGISASVIKAIEAAMLSRSRRTQTIDAFIANLNGDSEETSINVKPEPAPAPQPDLKPIVVTPEPKPQPVPQPSKSNKPVIFGIIAAAVVALCIVMFGGFGRGEDPVPPSPLPAPVAEEVVETATEVLTNNPSAPVVQQQPAEEKPEPEAAGYDVSFSCNVPSATLFVDGKANGSASESHFLKTGSHTIKVTADGYKDYTGKITVNSQTQPVKIKMQENPKPVVAETPVPAKEEAPVPAAKPTTGSKNGHEWVDLGLPSGTKWATMNVGANSPTDYGSYFAWGETSPKSSYDWSNLKYCLDNSGDKFSKYVTNSKYGTVDGKKELELSDDAAYVNWGSGWRMPSASQIDELKSNCTYVWTTMNGKYGYKVTSKKNGNSIFLPAAGYCNGFSVDNFSTWGYYWSRSFGTSGDSYAYDLRFKSDYFYKDDLLRRFGFCVRPVLAP